VTGFKLFNSVLLMIAGMFAYAGSHNYLRAGSNRRHRDVALTFSYRAAHNHSLSVIFDADNLQLFCTHYCVRYFWTRSSHPSLAIFVKK